MSRSASSILSVLTLPLLLALAGPSELAARQVAAETQLRVYLDCSSCDFDFVRTEIAYVDWMRDRADAELHVLVRSQVTGGGGREHTIDFIGLRRHVGKGDTLTYVSRPDDSQDITRRGLTRTLQRGLVRYLAGTPAADRVQISVAPAPADGSDGDGTPAASPAWDPWNAWVFQVGGNGFFNGESTRSQANVGTNLRASRVTAEWKIDLSGFGNYGRQSFTYFVEEADTTVVSIQRNYNASALAVRSVTGHASVGARLTAGTSTFGNTELSFTLSPAFEYNMFPYAESTRRQLIVRYGPGVLTQRYREETIFDRVEETRPIHSLTGAFSTRQPWGNMNFSIDGQQYFHDMSLYNLVFSGNASVNVVRGLSVNFGGNYTMVRDQISLAKRGATPEEVLLRQRQMATNYRFWGNFGLSYRFGSAIQNIVNPRFGAGGSGMMFFF